ncbi:MAG: LPS export ABC transporter periplasmic protein LptC [Candidatus Omnitrophota bacterium]
MKKILFIAILAAVLTANGCSKKEASSKAKKSTPDISQEESLGIKQEVYTFKVEGFNKDKKVQWGLEGESARVVFDKINITNLRAVYYGDDMTLTIFADSAVYDKKTQDIELKENIVGKTSDGGEFVTNYAKWNAKSEEITTDFYVVVRRQNITCRGRGLVTRPRLNWVSFEKEVEVDIAPDKKITCSGPFELDQKKRIAVFNNDVKITDKENETFADKLTVYLKAKTNEVERVVTEGSVKVVHRGDIEDMNRISF